VGLRVFELGAPTISSVVRLDIPKPRIDVRKPELFDEGEFEEQRRELEEKLAGQFREKLDEIGRQSDEERKKTLETFRESLDKLKRSTDETKADKKPTPEK
jgi:hypothetical protein